ncbi:hypothetical protein [Actinoplanes sp. NPDC049681]|uniref:hypothetical protein n=1 Tax=Actinoplanes sp. NPDC049681 TaxID=3363905 RepID=UPI00378A518F
MTLEQLMDKPALKNTRTIAATINSFVLLGSIAAGVLLTLIVNVRVSPALVAPASISVLAVVFCGAAYLHRTLRSSNPTAYRIRRLEGRLTVEPLGDHRRYHYQRFQTVEATRDDVRLVELREHWTGKGSRDSLTVTCVKPADGVLLDGKVPEEDGRVHRWVYPTRPLGRGETLDVEVHQTHIDDVETQRPYFRQGGGRYDTDAIRVQVSFPAGYEPTDIRGGVWNTGRPLLHNQLIRTMDCARTEDRAAGSVTYSVEAQRTPHHHSVGLFWTWPPSTSPQGRPSAIPAVTT